MVISYDENADGARVRKYYHLTHKGKKLLADKQREWDAYSQAVYKILNGGASYAAI
jgi:PadR family transcriptional regulator PadR